MTPEWITKSRVGRDVIIMNDGFDQDSSDELEKLLVLMEVVKGRQD